MDAVTHLAPTVGIVAACDFLAVARASFYRQRPVLGPPASPAPEPAISFILVSAGLCQDRQDWTHFVRIGGHGACWPVNI